MVSFSNRMYLGPKFQENFRPFTPYFHGKCGELKVLRVQIVWQCKLSFFGSFMLKSQPGICGAHNLCQTYCSNINACTFSGRCAWFVFCRVRRGSHSTSHACFAFNLSHFNEKSGTLCSAQQFTFPAIFTLRCTLTHSPSISIQLIPKRMANFIRS